MKIVGLCLLLTLLVGTSFVAVGPDYFSMIKLENLNLSTNTEKDRYCMKDFGHIREGAVISYGKHTEVPKPSDRKMKGHVFHGSGHKGDMSLDDYRPVDPSPSSKAVKPGPIQHGSPLIPYIPRSPPPSHHDYGDYDP